MMKVNKHRQDKNDSNIVEKGEVSSQTLSTVDVRRDVPANSLVVD
jgi:hypothetical protein